MDTAINRPYERDRAATGTDLNGTVVGNGAGFRGNASSRATSAKYRTARITTLARSINLSWARPVQTCVWLKSGRTPMTRPHKLGWCVHALRPASLDL